MENSLPDLKNFVPGAPGTRESSGRIYSGLPSSERARERQSRLIAAGVDVFGNQGYACAKIKTICQAAGLSERYFYESFDSREHLLNTVYDELFTQLMHAVVNAVGDPAMEPQESVRDGLAAVVNFMLDDPRKAQIMLVEIVGVSPELETKRHSYLNAFADESMRLLLLLSGIDKADAQARQAAGEGSPVLDEVLEFARLTGICMVGGVNNVLVDAILSGTTGNTKRITEVSLQLLCNASTTIRSLLAAG